MAPSYHPTHTVYFSGESIKTIVTNTASRVDDWVNHVRSMQGRLIVGLDIKWKPGYIRVRYNKTAVLQLCVQNKCLIVQIFHVSGIPTSLVNFLRDSSATFVGVGIKKDVSKLMDDYGLIVSHAVDLERLANCRLITCSSGLKRIALGVAGLRMEKPPHVTMSNWEARVLSHEQIEYACIDAYASYAIGFKLLVEKDDE